MRKQSKQQQQQQQQLYQQYEEQQARALGFLQLEAAADHLRTAEEAAAAARAILPHGVHGAGTGNQQPPSFIQYLAMSRGIHDGMQDGFASAGMPVGAFDYPMPQVPHIRRFCSSVSIPFSAFDGIRSSKHKVELTPAQEMNVLRSLAKIIAPQSDEDPQSSSTFFTSLYASRSADFAEGISVPLPFVDAFFFQRCPTLRRGVLTNSSSGATYLLLAVITGHVSLCQHCLEFGANPNSMVFLQDENPQVGEMFHGYSPVFMAVLAEQLPILDKLFEYGGSIHVYDRWGRTPLHAANELDSIEVVQWLLAKGAPRYVGDYLNFTAAESANEEYFHMLSMPNPALHGEPPLPPLEFLKRQQRRYLQGDSTKPTKTRAAPKEAAGAEKTDVTAEASPASQGSEESEEVPEGVQLCHCHSGRPTGFCGCVDDMYVRWSVDRLRSAWSPNVDFAALAKKQSAEGRQSMMAVGATRRRK